MSELIVEAVHKVLCHAILSNDEVIPITHWLDSEGAECDPYDALTCVAGPSSAGDWFLVELDQYEADTAVH